jgi:prepilin-type N-terminal cleavage/methylation domain-containing protein
MTSNLKNIKQKGFTLVELAIVLVIIGLIVSGVLVGQDLIKAAELRATVRQVQEFQVGVNTFIGKYSSIPGDADSDKYGLCDGEDDSPSGCSAVATANAAGSGCDGEANLGDGDGLIEDSNGAILEHTGEIACFWSHLTTPGKELIKGVFDGFEDATPAADVNDVVGENMPGLKFGSTGWGVFNDGTYNYFTTGVSGSHATDLYASTTDFVPIDAFNIDDKIDDGVPTTGDVITTNGHATAINSQAEAGSFLTYTNGGASAADCINSTPTPDEYQFTATANECKLRFKMQTF